MLIGKDYFRFWRKVQFTDGCWIWLAGRFSGGYGTFRINGRARYSHVLAWEDCFGPVPNGLHVLHTCDNPPCVRFDHLWLGTIADNNADKWAKGRGRVGHGSRHADAKINEAEAADMRLLYQQGMTQEQIAERYHQRIRRRNVGYIVKHVTWKHVP